MRRWSAGRYKFHHNRADEHKWSENHDTYNSARQSPAYNTSSQHVKVVTANPSNYWNKIVATQASGEGPDVFLMNNVNFKQWAHNNSIADLSSYLSTDRQVA